MAIRKSLLPSAYQQVEYIESSGTQYIDTNYANVSNNQRIVFCFEDTNTGGNAFFGSQKDTASRSGLAWRQNAGLGFGIGTQSASVVIGTYSRNQKLLLDYSSTSSTYSVSIDGTYLTQNTSYTGSNITTYNLFIFANNYIGSVESASGMKLYYCQIYDNGTLVRNFIPCYRKSDNEIGLYDTVNGVFYANAGTGDFTKGNDITPKANSIVKNSKYTRCVLKGTQPYFNWLPSEYQEVEYLAKTSGVAYIDTCRKGNLNTKAEVKFKYDTLPSSTSIIVGARGTSSTTNAFVMGITSGHEYYARFGNGSPTENRQAYDTDIHTMVNSVDGGFLDDTQIATYSTQSAFETPYPVALFASRENDGTITFSANCRIYYYKVWESGKLVQYLVPCYRKSDSVYGFFDLVSREFLVNANTSGSFTGGRTIHYELPSEYQMVEYINGDGSGSGTSAGPYINSGIIPNNTTGFSATVSFSQVSTDATRIGCRQSSTEESRFTFGVADSKVYFGWGSTVPASANRISVNANTFCNIKLNYLNDRKCQVDNVACVEDLPTHSTTFTYPIIIGGFSVAGDPRARPLKIKEIVFTSGTQITMKLIPCYRIADGVIGLYDIIGRQFYDNDGTGSYTKGSDI